jgi:hypothetical protein
LKFVCLAWALLVLSPALVGGDRNKIPTREDAWPSFEVRYDTQIPFATGMTEANGIFSSRHTLSTPFVLHHRAMETTPKKLFFPGILHMANENSRQ